MKTEQPERYLLSRRQLASRWVMSIPSLKRREKAGLLQPLIIGKSVRYRIPDIERIEAQAEVRL